jgi:hypothetical protein
MRANRALLLANHIDADAAIADLERAIARTHDPPRGP